ncbi:MAG: PQQ-dependent sugar dehydrogenase [Phycisphaerae bacterium]|nr:PQQ-dependent sugar dehydrogenase [Phycisphaerae bacterium]
MAVRRVVIRLAAIVSSLLACGPLRALPPGFVDLPVGGTWNQAVGLTFAPDGRMFVWEKGGRVWNFENGQQSATPLVNISEEVGDWRDHGLLGFAIDPAFYTNGYIYLLYVVDYHHLVNFGTPAYNPNSNQYFRDTIARLTRYQCDPATGFRTVLPGSRTVLIGETITTGIPIPHQSHGAGTLVFSPDGTLLLTCGDGASYETFDHGGTASGSSNTALADGIITPAENVGAWRAQLIASHSGKVLRIDPATGDGVPSNPFYLPGSPRAPQSRVWAMGLRNPFRACLRPGTGSTNPNDANPGTLYIGDVGWGWWEEINVCREARTNFGWPYFEGLEVRGGYAGANVANLTAPNPRFGVGGCTQQFFTFSNLIVQETLGATSFPNPCNASFQIPATTPTHEHTRPKIDYGHGSSPSRTGIFIGNNAAVINVGAPGSPVTGAQFGGFSSTGGTWYTGSDFPADYTNVYYHGDYVSGWIRAFVFDAMDNPTAVREFVPEGQAGGVVDLETSPTEGGLFYIRYNEVGSSEVRRIAYLGNTNLPPVAVGSAGPTFGPSPLSVQFSSLGSFDPEGAAITYLWDFGDGSPTSTAANPTHLYQDTEDITATGTIVARVFELNPPNPIGGGNHDPEIIRDGFYPPVGSNNSATQFDTYHAGDQGNFDYIGYTFPAARTFTSLRIQEGIHFGDGGWWDSAQFEFRHPVTGVWTAVPGVTVTPSYPGNNGVNCETFAVTFPPVVGTGIRIAGNPGGSANFVSQAEFRVNAVPLNPGAPRRFDATLTVCDQIAFCDTEVVPVWINNTPPSVEITSPIDGDLYNPDLSFTQPLTSMISDAEHATESLACQWITVLHHNAHTHPEPPDPNCTSSSQISPHGQSTDTFFWEFVLTVTDPLGLSATRTATIVPAPPRCPGDANLDGVVDFADMTSVLSNWGAIGPFGDANNDGIVSFADVTEVLGFWGAPCP